MKDGIEAGLRRDVGGDQVADLADHRLMRTDLKAEGRARIPAQRAPAAFQVRRVDHPLGVVLALGGELDVATAPLLQAQLDRVTRGGAVVTDLSGLGFIDSTGLGMLVRAERDLRAAGGQLVLVRGSRAVHRAFELTSLDRYFTWSDAPGAALRTARERCAAGPAGCLSPPPDRQIEGELDRELGGAMWA